MTRHHKLRFKLIKDVYLLVHDNWIFNAFGPWCITICSAKWWFHYWIYMSMFLAFRYTKTILF